MVRQEETKKLEYYYVYVAQSVDGRPKILKTYKTGLADVVYALISQAERHVVDGHYLATNDPATAEKYNLKLIK